jgi:endo-1,4-beta-xylanase
MPVVSKFGLFSAVALCQLACASTPPEPEAMPGDTGGTGGTLATGTSDTPLRMRAGAANRVIGAALGTYHFSDPNYKPVAAREFNGLTPENEMKWEAIGRTEGVFDFSRGDQLVAFANENGMKVRGHTLVWYQALPAWVKALSGEPLRTAMLRHVSTVAAHFKGKVVAWDVVNEAFADGSAQLRANSPFTALGVDYIEQAFRAARQADPDAKLYYNDYEGEAVGQPKSEGIYALVKRLKESGVPIDGVGLQMHLDPRRMPSLDAIGRNLDRLIALGLTVNISEMDVPLGQIPGDAAQKLAGQAKIYADVVALCVARPACDGITFWGLSDKHSWLNDPMWEQYRGAGPHLPLLFDTNYQRKPAWQGVASALAPE